MEFHRKLSVKIRIGLFRSSNAFVAYLPHQFLGLMLDWCKAETCFYMFALKSKLSVAQYTQVVTEIHWEIQCTDITMLCLV